MNNRKMHRVAAVLSTLVLLAFAGRASAFVERMYSLKEIMDESTNICLGKVTSVAPDKSQFTCKIDRDLKGENPYKTLLVDYRSCMKQFIPYMKAAVKPGQSILVFYKKAGSAVASECYLDHYWVQLHSSQTSNPSRMTWRMTHVEIRMNRTWHKSFNELVNVVTKVVAGQMQPPPPDPNTPPFNVQEETAKLGADAGGGGPAVGRIFGRHVALPHGGGAAHGATWIDFDCDGDLDAYISCQAGNELYRADPGGIFMCVTREVGLSGGSLGAAWADYNGDGRPDLLLPTPKLFTNLGDKFRDDTALLPNLPDHTAESCGWIDYDGDGWVDVLMPNGEHGIAVFRNTGQDKGRFKDVSADVGLGPDGPGSAKGHFVSIVDFDGDGFSDFLYNAGEGILFRNTGEGKFEEVKNSGIKFAATYAHKIGVAWGDYDNDGDLDVFVPQNNAAKLYRNNNDGTFDNVTTASGDLANVVFDWTAAVWGDVDRDGWLDLYVGKGSGDARLFLNQGDGTFANMVEPLGLYHVPGNARVFGATMGDFDGDGDLDILSNSLDGRCTVFINDYSHEDPKRSFLVVRAKGTKGVIGATVRLFDEKDRLLGLRELGVAQNAGSQTDVAAFFGLPGGKYKVSVCMSDGGFGEKKIEVGEDGLSVEVAAKLD